jgi:hypothetical protein
MSATADELREEVRRRYAESARAVTESSGGCGSGACCSDEQAAAEAKFGELLYDAEQREPETKGLPVIQPATAGCC